ncbi:uncharacterized protein LOC111379998 [Olea europaea var. sylvestris]|uniref:uncharacterized protein LOC111379998 n=1 Tax=Olea europaea var. sylvestris TaxID=158386 RepID=UPI000C1CCD92|nr:uncharacterized protein LOC111379998 [Olea europaea var. sylvestris]
MEGADSTDGSLDIDLENGGTKSEENGSKSQGLGGGNSKKLLSRVRSGFLRGESPDGSKSTRDRSHSYDKLLDLDEVSLTNMEFKFGNARNETINNLDKEKSKKPNCVKPSKPPRPPKGPSLDAADLKMLKEISMLNLKRKRMEKIRTLKTIKKEKASSLSTNLFAIFVTIIFFYVIIFQGNSFMILVLVIFFFYAVEFMSLLEIPQLVIYKY